MELSQQASMLQQPQKQSLDEKINDFILFYTEYARTTFANVCGELTRILTPRGVAICLSIIGTLLDVFNYCIKTVGRIFGSVIDEFSTSGNLWLFFGEETRPIPYKICTQPPQGVSWVYNNIGNALLERDSGQVVDSDTTFSYIETNPRKLPWIMTVVTSYQVDNSGNAVKSGEYYLDEWLSNFFVDVHDRVEIHPKILLSCWGINSGVVFGNNEVVRLEVMDKSGNLVVFEDINRAFDENEFRQWKNLLGLSVTAAETETESVSEVGAT